MNFGYDVKSPQYARCLAKSWPASGITSSLLLSATGSIPDSDALCNGIPFAIDYAETSIQLCLEHIATSHGFSDLAFAGTTLRECCQAIHRHLLEVCEYIGQGIYISGAIVYTCPDRILMFPFGGAAIYAYQDSKLTRLGSDSSSPFIRDAMGGSEIWTPVYWQAPVSENPHLFCLSHPLEDIHSCNEILQKQVSTGSHPNTASMLLRREIDRQIHDAPSAVMELQF